MRQTFSEPCPRSRSRSRSSAGRIRGLGQGDPERVAQCGGGMGEGGTLVFSFQGRRRETPSGRFKGFSGVRGTLHRSLAHLPKLKMNVPEKLSQARFVARSF